jgi:tetratricopeptide (TPR) repeat protein
LPRELCTALGPAYRRKSMNLSERNVSRQILRCVLDRIPLEVFLFASNVKCSFQQKWLYNLISALGAKLRNRRILLLSSVLVLISCGRSAQDYLEKANTFASAGKYADAALNYRKAIQKNSEFGEAHYQLALTEIKLGHRAAAYEELSQAGRLLPARVDVQSALADLVLKAYVVDRNRPKRLYDQLTDMSQKLLAADPKSYDGLRIKGYLAATEGRSADALGFFGAAASVKPLEPELTLARVELLLLSRRAAEGERLALDLIEKHKDYGPAYDVLFRQYVITNRRAEAQNLIETKVRNNPNAAGFAVQLASYYASVGRREDMTATLQRLLDNPAAFPKGHVLVGDFYARLQEWDLALRHYDEGAKADPKNRVEYLKRSANVWLSQGKGEQAAGLVDQILKDHPKDEQAGAVNASLLMKSGDPKKIDRAVAELQGLVKENPSDAVLRLSLGHALLAKGNTEAARTEFLETLNRHKDYMPALLAMAELSRSKGQYTETLRYSDELLKLNPNLRQVRLLRSVALMGTGDLNQARRELTRLQKDFPQFREAELQLAYVDLDQKKFPEAEVRFQKLLQRVPGDGAAQTGLVRTLVASNQSRKAYDYLKAEVKKTPDSEAVQNLLAEVAVHLGDYNSAIEQYRSLVARKASPGVYVQLGSVYNLKGDVPNALAALESAEKLAPSDPAVVALLAQTRNAAGRRQEALEGYRRVLKLKPENAAVMNDVAFLIVETGGRPDEALELAQQAVRKAPQEPNFSDTLGWVYYKKGMSDAALQVFRNLAQKYPENPVFHYHLGMALRKAGDEATARKEFQVALSNKPSSGLSADVKEALASQAK